MRSGRPERGTTSILPTVTDLSQRVAITGVGLVTPIGIGRTATWAAILEGRSGAGPITLFDASAHGSQIGCEVTNFDPLAFIDHRAARRMDRVAQLAVAAGRLALDDSGLGVTRGGERIGTIIGCGNGGNGSFEVHHRTLLERGPSRVSPLAISTIITNMAAAHVSMELGLRGPLSCPVTACASSTHAIGEAADTIRRGDADAMIAGGSEAAITPFSMAGLDASRAMTRNNADPQGASRPFDVDRDGFLIGEAAAVVVLERLDLALARGATILCEIAGYSATCDAYHVTEPEPSGGAQTDAMRVALAHAGLEPEQIDYVNAHATSTVAGDKVEIRSIIGALGVEHASGTAVSATKSMHGHCLGATGGLEAAITALAIADGVVPATINLGTLDPDCAGVDHVLGTPRTMPIAAALSSSFGFGGHNAVLAFTRGDQ